MEIKRDKYLKRLISKRNNGLIKVITGIRRCGKSYLLFNLYYDYLMQEGVPEDCIISVPLDDDDYIEYCNPQKLSEYIKSRITDPDIISLILQSFFVLISYLISFPLTILFLQRILSLDLSL